MANSVSVQIQMTVTTNGVTLQQNVGGSSTTTIAGDEAISNIQIVGTSSEIVQLGDVSTIGYVLAKNLDATNFVEFSVDNANAQKFAKLLPGDVTLVKASAAFYAKADTASCKVFFQAAEL